MNNRQRISRLAEERKLSRENWIALFSSWSAEDLEYAMELARKTAVGRFGKKIYFRGIIEFSNFCKNDCYYCGIRCSNRHIQRYRLSQEDILACCEEGYKYGFRTFVLQSGEDPYYQDDRLTDLVRVIRGEYPDCAITLSVGERSKGSYQRLYDAGADRYLLRHETADPAHYRMLHPENLSLSNRIECLWNLREIGFQTGCGFMVGTPGQTPESLTKDMLFMTDFHPEMVGIGPFIPHHETPFAQEQQGSVDLTLLCMSLTRLLLPQVLLPSTTALGTAEKDGRQKGVLAGCNVVMPNLSPLGVRKKYMLYDNKAGTEIGAEEGIRSLAEQMQEIGYEVVVGRGDYQEEEEIRK